MKNICGGRILTLRFTRSLAVRIYAGAALRLAAKRLQENQQIPLFALYANWGKWYN